MSPRRVVGTSQQDISLAAEALVRGEVVISPTDTHYTLLASPAQEAGSARIYEIKKRDSDFPLTIFLSGPGGRSVAWRAYAYSSQASFESS